MREGKKRARNDDEKLYRKDTILETALMLFNEKNGKMPKISEIAALLGLSKGTLYLYFKTKEEIFLELCLNEVQTWFQEISKDIKNFPENIKSKDLALLLSGYIRKKPNVLNMIAILHIVLEKKNADEIVYQTKVKIAQILKKGGELFSNIIPNVKAKDGSHFLLSALALIIGLWQYVDIPDNIRSRLAEENLEQYFPSFNDNIIDAVAALARGTFPSLEE